MGLVGGGIWAGGKVTFTKKNYILTHFQSLVRREPFQMARNIRINSPRTAAGFAVWESVEI